MSYICILQETFVTISVDACVIHIHYPCSGDVGINTDMSAVFSFVTN